MAAACWTNAGKKPIEMHVCGFKGRGEVWIKYSRECFSNMKMGRSDSGMTLSAGVCNPPSLKKQVQSKCRTQETQPHPYNIPVQKATTVTLSVFYKVIKKWYSFCASKSKQICAKNGYQQSAYWGPVMGHVWWFMVAAVEQMNAPEATVW